jgi:hypothetical protein
LGASATGGQARKAIACCHNLPAPNPIEQELNQLSADTGATRMRPVRPAPPKLLTGTYFDRVKPKGRIPHCNSGRFRKLQLAQKLGEERVTGNAPVKFQN